MAAGHSGGVSKYRGIAIAVSLFLVLIATIAGLNLYIASKLDQDAVAINLAGRQRMLSQRMTKVLLQLANAPDQAPGLLEELRNAAALFDSTISAFANGAIVTGGDGKPTRLEAVTAGTAPLKEGLAIWVALKSPLDEALDPAAENESLSKAAAQFGANNLALLGKMNELTTALEEDSRSRSGVLRAAQLAAMGLAVILFSYIVLFGLRKLRRADADIQAARDETDNILNTVNDGLFLIDRSLVIGKQHSRSLSRIFGTESLGGVPFLTVLEKLVPAATLETAREFLDLLFGDRVKEALMVDVNPLRQVQVSTTSADGRIERRHLAFQFRRVLTLGKPNHLLVSAADVTTEVELREELQRSRLRGEQQMSLLSKMMHVSSEELATFIDKTRKALDEVNETLAAKGVSKAGNAAKLKSIYRLVHAIKGDAAALEFEPIESWAHGFEDIIAGLQKQSTLEGTDLMPLTVQLRDLYQQLDEVTELVSKLGTVRRSLAQESQVGPGPVWNLAQQVAAKVAARAGKRVRFEVVSAENVKVPAEIHDAVSDLIVQLTRNAVVHGIETPEQRISQGKSEAGHLLLNIDQNAEGAMQISLRDDGRGLDMAAIRRTAIARGLMSAEQADQASSNQLISLIFQPGFTTAEEVSLDAGRGIGLDVLHTKVRSLGGRMIVQSSPGQGSRFGWSMPVHANASGVQC